MDTMELSYVENTPPKRWLERPVIWRITPAYILLGIIMLLSLGLHFYNIQSIGDSNTYYTAAVKSMLQSWHNFFFVAAEPGGSVSVDKPPLGLWIEAAFAAVLGVSGFSVVLPNILAGVLSIPILYHLVKKYSGEEAGLIAALVLTVTPVSLAVDRNNTIDGMLILALLLSAWAFIKATETGKLHFLLLGALGVGLGFNIKMLQAFLPLPAFYALYFFGAKTSWGRKILQLGLATVVLVVVSLSWAVAVDLTPANQRPYVGSSSNNSELDLILGYNGVNRLVGMMGGQRNTGGNAQTPPGNNPSSNSAQPGFASQPDSSSQANPDFQNPPENGNLPPNPPSNISKGSGLNAPNFPGQNGGGGPRGGGMMGDIGKKSVLRFFQPSLGKEMSWLLPFALLAGIVTACSGRIRLPLILNEHKSVILWGSWLLICLFFFSIAGFFHNYYLAMLSPALGAVVGIGFTQIERLKTHNYFWAGGVWAAAVGATLAFQMYLVNQLGLAIIWVWIAVGLFILSGIFYMVNHFWKRNRNTLYHLAMITVLISILVIPTLWTIQTVVTEVSTNLPAAYSGDNSNGMRNPGGAPVGQANNSSNRPAGGGPGGGFNSGGVSQEMLEYLQTNTQDVKYLVAVPGSKMGSSLVLQTGRPVLFMGGFSGQTRWSMQKAWQNWWKAGSYATFFQAEASRGAPAPALKAG